MTRHDDRTPDQRQAEALAAAADMLPPPLAVTDQPAPHDRLTGAPRPAYPFRCKCGCVILAHSPGGPCRGRVPFTETGLSSECPCTVYTPDH